MWKIAYRYDQFDETIFEEVIARFDLEYFVKKLAYTTPTF